jgi:hypothetical protein
MAETAVRQVEKGALLRVANLGRMGFFGKDGSKNSAALH